MINGKSLIKSQLSSIPTLPGVYRMMDKHKVIIYIGKAKNLKNRLSQYNLNLSDKNEAMISLTHYLEYSVTDTESNALILEARMIKRFKPKFNILLKDDKSLPYIKLRLDTDYPQILKYRGKDLQHGKFFGPFASARHVQITINELQKIFKLRSCTDSYFATRSRPCMEYQIKKCSAPCVGKITKEAYDDLTNQIKAFFAGKNTDLQKMLSEKMQRLSDEMKFEAAAAIRDKIRSLSYIQMKSGINGNILYEADIIALAHHNGEYCLQLFMYRQNQPCGNNPYFPYHTNDEEPSEVLRAFILQFYQTKIPPKEILVSHQLEETELIIESLKTMHNVNVKIKYPKVGEKVDLMANAIQNAQIALERHLKTTAKNMNALTTLKGLFNLDKIPERIEVYDNSHIQGSFAVGAMIVAGREGFEKKEYRLFSIKEDSPNDFGGDDYAMLREVLSRRFARLKKEAIRTPDLIIIDGGKGHMNVTKEVMQRFSLTLPFICMSKGVDRNSGNEQFHTMGRESFTIDKKLPVMKYLQILRDEAHNFAITSHRNKRSKAITYSSLDDIPNIGQKRKKTLLSYFGSFRAINDATIKELSKVDGISSNIAKQIYDTLRNLN